MSRTTIDSLLVQDDNEEEEEEEEEHYYFPIKTPFISPQRRRRLSHPREDDEQRQHCYNTTTSHSNSNSSNNNNNNNNIVGILAAALRKSLLVTCSVVDTVHDFSSTYMDIGFPTDVRHVSHVTFDRFNGFLGLPLDLLPQLPPKVPSASASVFGVSANSMQCSYDQRGNSVPTILLMMQKQLYSGGGLQAEGIFRINAENSKEELVRKQLSTGFVPRGIDVHCLAGLIKAWFRELPSGVLDSLSAEKVMNCNTEDECTQLVKQLPPTEVALLDWATNLMADVVQNEHLNKMNAHNIALVFAPNMTQMADPLTALIHAVQVMNLLKTLILRILREREESSTTVRLLPSPDHDYPISKAEPHLKNEKFLISCVPKELEHGSGNLLQSATLDRLESDHQLEERFWWSNSKNDSNLEDCDSVLDVRPTVLACTKGNSENGLDAEGGILNRLRFTKQMRRLCRHPVFRLSKLTVKKSGTLRSNVNTRGGGEEACA